MQLVALILGMFAAGAALIQLEHCVHSRGASERRHGWLKFSVFVMFVALLLLVRLWGIWPAAGLLLLTFIIAFRELRELLPRSPLAAAMLTATVILGLSHLLQPGGRDGFETWVATILLVSVTDAFAQLGGNLIGRHKLCPKLSPGKTVEGLIGGIAAAAVLAAAIGFLLPHLQLAERLALGIATAGAAVAGDLLFSGLKRRAGVKDFSNLIPAHGGVLDRLDSLVLGAPAFYWTLHLLAS